MFGKIEFLPEIEHFRNNLKEIPFLYKTLIQSDNGGRKGEFENTLIKLKLSEIFGLNELWFKEVENSVDSYSTNNRNMISYRITFQTASDNLYKLVSSIVPHMDPSINKVEAIVDVTNNILNENYWQGEDVLKTINFSRFFRTSLYFSDKWIYEYMKNLLTN